jgi:hypothetical protein
MKWKDMLKPDFQKGFLTVILLIAITISGLCRFDATFVCLKVDVFGAYIDGPVGSRGIGYNPGYVNFPSLAILVVAYLAASFAVNAYRRKR